MSNPDSSARHTSFTSECPSRAVPDPPAHPSYGQPKKRSSYFHDQAENPSSATDLSDPTADASDALETTNTTNIPPNVVVVQHPLVGQLLGRLRDKRTDTATFHHCVVQISELLTYEATRDLPTHTLTVETPVDTALVEALSGREPIVVPILRAGLGMLSGVRTLLPHITVGQIGLFRDERTLEPHTYYTKLPSDVKERDVFILDPMVATGGSAIKAIDLVKHQGCQRISLLCIISAPEGLQAISEHHPDARIYTCAVDKGLDGKGYIVPGLGDAGDRLFGTIED